VEGNTEFYRETGHPRSARAGNGGKLGEEGKTLAGGGKVSGLLVLDWHVPSTDLPLIMLATVLHPRSRRSLNSRKLAA
jgi:hypothetical protein